MIEILYAVQGDRKTTFARGSTRRILFYGPGILPRFKKRIFVKITNHPKTRPCQ
jgi:hypothetical protein